MLPRLLLIASLACAAASSACSTVVVGGPHEPDAGLASEYAPTATSQRAFDEDPYRGVEYSDARVAGEFGAREYRHANWEQLDSPSVLGVTGSREPPSWPLGADVGIFYVYDSGRLAGTRVDAEAWEGYAGLMKSVELLRGRLILQAGAGGAINYYEVDPGDPLLSHEDAFWTSVYGRLGATLRISKEFEFGLAVRSARGGSFNLLDTSLDGDYDHATFVLSASW